MLEEALISINPQLLSIFEAFQNQFDGVEDDTPTCKSEEPCGLGGVSAQLFENIDDLMALHPLIEEDKLRASSRLTFCSY